MGPSAKYCGVQHVVLSHGAIGVRPEVQRCPPPPHSLSQPKFKPPQSEGAGRGLAPAGDLETGGTLFAAPPPPPPQGEKPNQHTLCPTSSPFALQVQKGSEIPKERGATLAVTSSTGLALLRSLASDPPPPPRLATRPPRPHPQREGLRMSRPLGLHMVVAVEGSE